MKAERNRTLTIADDERIALKQDITTLDQISSGFSFDNTTIQADLFDVLPLMPDAFADLIIIDPPYNLAKDFNGTKFKSMSNDDYENYLRSWFGRVCDKLKPDGSLYLCGDWKSTAAMQRVIEESGLTILNRITWQREKGRGAKTNWKNGMEDIWFAVKNPKNYYFNVEAVMMKRKVIAPYRVDGVAKDWMETEEGNFRITYPSNFWDDISIPFWSMPENTDHPTQKPEKLIAKLILASSEPGDLVFDPFLGSGTTSVVAKKLGRIYCGVELNEEYCLFATKRLQTADHDTSIQGYKDQVFWERNTLQEQSKKTIPA
ncbi:MAG: site-specific DNA-methyltransferase [Muribaculaceae bacterium]|nr:site-specific DNA-methyltransferase [Muribaculaceae bacterium]